MKFKFWGVRGSIPTPGPQTNKYGGNTTCIEIRTDKDLVEHYGFKLDDSTSKSFGLGVGIATEKLDRKTMGRYEMV